MRLLASTTLALAVTVFSTEVMDHDEKPNALSSRNPNVCFGGRSAHCTGHQAPASTAYRAIIKACEQIPSCPPAPDQVVKGKVLGFTATVKLGDQCAGFNNNETTWDVSECVGLFADRLQGVCKGDYPAAAGTFQLGFVKASCDDTFLAFNYGG